MWKEEGQVESLTELCTTKSYYNTGRQAGIPSRERFKEMVVLYNRGKLRWIIAFVVPGNNRYFVIHWKFNRQYLVNHGTQMLVESNVYITCNF